MDQMATYWSTTVQLMAVLALATVFELRATIGAWKYVPPWLRWIQGTIHLIVLGAAALVMAQGLQALVPGADNVRSLVPVAQLSVAAMVGTLIISPALTIAVRSFSGPISWLLSRMPMTRLRALRLRRKALRNRRDFDAERRRFEALQQSAQRGRSEVEGKFEALRRGVAVSGDPELALAFEEAMSLTAAEYRDTESGLAEFAKRMKVADANLAEAEREVDQLLRGLPEAAEQKRRELEASLSLMGDDVAPSPRSHERIQPAVRAARRHRAPSSRRHRHL